MSRAGPRLIVANWILLVLAIAIAPGPVAVAAATVILAGFVPGLVRWAGFRRIAFGLVFVGFGVTAVAYLQDLLFVIQVPP